jgi:integrase
MAGYYEKTKSGKYRLFASAGQGPGGKRKRLTKTVEARSDREAEKLLAQFVAEVERGQYIEPSKITFKEFTERWIKNYAEKNLAPKTLFRYKQMLETRVFPAMGHLKVEQVRPVHLMEFYANLQEEGVRFDGKKEALSNQTILHHHRLLSTIFNDAVEWEVIPTNPAAKVKPPKVKRKQADFYGEEQMANLFTALGEEDLKHKTLVTLALFTGLRRGELMGLEWSDVDFENNTIIVRRTSQYLPGKGTFTKDTKTEMSKRTITVPGSVISLLKEYRKQWVENKLKVGDMWQGSNRLFTTWNGKPGHPEWPSQWFSKFIRKHKLPHLTFHGLRHTAATILINQGVPAKNISARLGHSNISTTMDIYGHILKSADKEAADRLEQVYQKIKINGVKERT